MPASRKIEAAGPSVNADPTSIAALSARAPEHTSPPPRIDVHLRN
jgi:hypothetical protein